MLPTQRYHGCFQQQKASSGWPKREAAPAEPAAGGPRDATAPHVCFAFVGRTCQALMPHFWGRAVQSKQHVRLPKSGMLFITQAHCSAPTHPLMCSNKACFRLLWAWTLHQAKNLLSRCHSRMDLCRRSVSFEMASVTSSAWSLPWGALHLRRFVELMQ